MPSFSRVIGSANPPSTNFIGERRNDRTGEGAEGGWGVATYRMELTREELDEVESLLDVEIVQTRRAIHRATPNSEFKQNVTRHERFLSALRAKVRDVKHEPLAA